jgi:hypothetical protein
MPPDLPDPIPPDPILPGQAIARAAPSPAPRATSTPAGAAAAGLARPHRRHGPLRTIAACGAAFGHAREPVAGHAPLRNAIVRTSKRLRRTIPREWCGAKVRGQPATGPTAAPNETTDDAGLSSLGSGKFAENGSRILAFLLDAGPGVRGRFFVDPDEDCADEAQGGVRA